MFNKFCKFYHKYFAMIIIFELDDMQYEVLKS